MESPAKAKTIAKYLGPDFEVAASVGHVRDLPSKAPRGSKQPVPGVDLEHRFRPSYVILPGKQKTVAELRKKAREAQDIWFATDLDREGEAIAWHLAQILGVEPATAKRVVFNAITKDQVQRAFAHPHPIDENKVNAQQARRILDRIVGYQASPFLWKKVARGLSAGRVQSVAVRMIVEREREIAAFVPDESWRISAGLTPEIDGASALSAAYAEFVATPDEKGKPRSAKARQAFATERGGFFAVLWQLGGKRFELGCTADEPKDLSEEVRAAAEAVGLTDVRIATVEDPEGKGPARFRRTVTGRVDPAARYRVISIERKRTKTRPPAPFITSSLQIAAANQLGMSASRTMRIAQGLYEGVDVPGEGRVGLITYMRTDSTHLSGEALAMARSHIGRALGERYLPAKPNFFSSSNKDAQEAHEAIRPTDVARTPDKLRGVLTPEQWKLYDLVWRRFVASQMVPAEWDQTAVLFERADRATGAVLRATGRTLAFDGFYRVLGVPAGGDEQTLPPLAEGQEVAPFAIEPEQRFSNPPPRYTEASLVKALEAEGIGRPSTYAQIISVIQDRGYVEQIDRRFHATDLGEVVTDKLMEAFPELMDIGYTRQMEAKLDAIEEEHADWVEMLEAFYADFARDLERALEEMSHAKAEIQPAPYACPKCGARTQYRFGRNGRFLSCSRYPDCDYAAPIDRQGRPQLPERVDVACPEDGSPMVLRKGRFGPFLASENYPETSFVINLDRKGGIKYPSPPPLVTDLSCPKCGAPMHLRRGKRGPWLGCSTFPKCRGRIAWKSLPDDEKERLEAALAAHEKEHPQIVIRRLDGTPIPEGTKVSDLLIPGGAAELEIHPEAAREAASPAGASGGGEAASPAT
ncbi:MAG: type I DNA topoisomerase [Deltaproteobacteria bacterium]|nr:MAG: type I DNA topoisomerase [Deltaproteobacteria bacterium]